MLYLSCWLSWQPTWLNWQLMSPSWDWDWDWGLQKEMTCVSHTGRRKKRQREGEGGLINNRSQTSSMQMFRHHSYVMWVNPIIIARAVWVECGHICGFRYQIWLGMRIRIRMCFWQLFLIYAWRLNALISAVVINQVSWAGSLRIRSHNHMSVCGAEGWGGDADPVERVNLQPDFT